MTADAHLIESPPRSGRVAGVLILVTVALHAAFNMDAGTALAGATTVVGTLFVFSLMLRDDAAAIHVTLLALLIILWQEVWPSGWVFYLLGPLAIYLGIVALVPSLRRTTGWLRVGRLDRTVGLLIALTILISSAALVGWFVLLRPDTTVWSRTIPHYPLILVILGGIGFSVVNAAVEESIYRGVLMHALDAAVGPGRLSVFLQAVPFGLIHLHGVPNGWAGVGMAGIYGVMLGVVRRRAAGMLAPFLAHILADGVIFTLLLLTRPRAL